MLPIALAILIVLQPLAAQCAVLTSLPASCASPCGQADRPQTPQNTEPCCKFAPAKSNPQAVKTATIELRANDGQPVMLPVEATAASPLAPSLNRAEAVPTDLLHKRSQSEVLCTLLI